MNKISSDSSSDPLSRTSRRESKSSYGGYGLSSWENIVSGLVHTASAGMTVIQQTTGTLTNLGVSGSTSHTTVSKPMIASSYPKFDQLVMKTEKKLIHMSHLSSTLERLMEFEAKRTFEISQVGYFLKQV